MNKAIRAFYIFYFIRGSYGLWWKKDELVKLLKSLRSPDDSFEKELEQITR